MPLKKTFQQLADEAKSRISEASPPQVLAMVESEENFVLIDVRENDEFRQGHLPGARGIGRGVLEYHIEEEVPDTETPIVLYCRGGNRSALAAAALGEMGYENVTSMSGGFREWASDNTRPISHEGEPIEH
jgi:rhodanese-related sulfurtransferase